MSVFDLIIFAILAALTLRGIWKGMISQIVSVAFIFVCWIVATRFGGLIAPSIPVEAPWNQVLAMGVLFLITLVAIWFASTAFEKLIKHWHLQKLNTLLGGLLGFAKGLLICMIITFFSVMVSEASRGVVFNSVTGFHLVRLIATVIVFVPKDSYEFVHNQLIQFQNKVDEAVPGQVIDPLQVQSSPAVQQMLAQIEQAKEKPEASAASLFGALSKWWKGEKPSNPAETVPSAPKAQTAQKTEPNPPAAKTYVPPMPIDFSASPPANTFANTPQPAMPKPATTSDTFFMRSPEPSQPPPSFPTLAPLSEIPALSEPQLLPLNAIPTHVGSDLLLQNSRQPAKPNAAAQVFRPF